MEIDLSKCPKCGGPADNGHDRCLPPSPYYCTKCTGDEQPVDLREELRKSAASAYCRYIDLKTKFDCQGWEAKMTNGTFGKAQLDAHCLAHEALGEHRAFSAAYRLMCGPSSDGEAVRPCDHDFKAAGWHGGRGDAPYLFVCEHCKAEEWRSHAPPSWEELAQECATKFVNELSLPYGEGKDKDIRDALHVFIQTQSLFKRLVMLGVEIGKEGVDVV